MLCVCACFLGTSDTVTGSVTVRIISDGHAPHSVSLSLHHSALFALCPLQVLGYCIRSLSHGSVSREKEFLLRNSSIDAEVLRKRKFRVLIGVGDAECLQRWGRRFICIRTITSSLDF